ncbi:sugar-transfer associated ATP-grasp domain-containing protein [Spongiivirga citrea]|uniref:Alpha-L-glutamate ligase-related protein ATP-grasp domain-containing protein n=1 Tax=Spongiivirga citrea TaxID=1481457 RepID=A0A6M0CKH6_9FLAO|nr:sugar-transfer associated ATP-grasp domain-containing protein [Spongiivirga citrea]NER18152.1 hypothetical protein [Spongiivirga citrea]
MKKLNYFLKDPERKNLFVVVNELMYLLIKQRTVPSHYFAKYLYRKRVKNINDYLTTQEVKRVSFSRYFNKAAMLPFFENKVVMALFCKKNSLPHPRMLCNNYGKWFNINGKTICIETKSNLVDLLKEIMIDNKLDVLFVKEVDNHGGVGCFKIENSEDSFQQKEIGEMLSGNYLVQECIEQHTALSALNPNSINSIRIDTYVDEKGEGHILTALMRFGVGKSVVDNASSGGFYVGIDMEKGTLKEMGQQLFSYGGKSYKAHPDTNTIFKDYSIPYFQETCALIHKLMKLLPDGFVGWDIAITSNGPMIIEGNTQSGILMADISYGGLRAHPKFKEILSRLP